MISRVVSSTSRTRTSRCRNVWTEATSSSASWNRDLSYLVSRKLIVCSNLIIVFCLESAEEERRKTEKSNDRNSLNDNLLELLTSCESFELRVSVLEQNCDENFRELFKLIEKTRQQQRENQLWIVQQKDAERCRKALEELAVPPPPLEFSPPLEFPAKRPLAPAVSLFSHPPLSFGDFTQNQLSILMQEGKLPLSTDNSEPLQPAATAPAVLAPSYQHIQREWSPYMNSSGKMEVGPIMDPEVETLFTHAPHSMLTAHRTW